MNRFLIFFIVLGITSSLYSMEKEHPFTIWLPASHDFEKSEPFACASLHALTVKDLYSTTIVNNSLFITLNRCAKIIALNKELCCNKAYNERAHIIIKLFLDALIEKFRSWVPRLKAQSSGNLVDYNKLISLIEQEVPKLAKFMATQICQLDISQFKHEHSLSMLMGKLLSYLIDNYLFCLFLNSAEVKSFLGEEYNLIQKLLKLYNQAKNKMLYRFILMPPLDQRTIDEANRYACALQLQNEIQSNEFDLLRPTNHKEKPLVQDNTLDKALFDDLDLSFEQEKDQEGPSSNEHVSKKRKRDSSEQGFTAKMVALEISKYIISILGRFDRMLDRVQLQQGLLGLFNEQELNTLKGFLKQYADQLDQKVAEFIAYTLCTIEDEEQLGRLFEGFAQEKDALPYCINLINSFKG